MEDGRVLNDRGVVADDRGMGRSLVGQLVLVGLMGAVLVMPALPRATRPDRARAQADAVAAAIEAEASAAIRALGPVAARLRAGEPVDWKEFARLTAEDPAGLDPADHGRLYAWLPWVPAQARAAYENRTGHDGYRSFRLVQSSADGPRPAGVRREHLPVHLAAPAEPSSAWLGLDLAGDVELRTAAERARRDGDSQVVGPRRLVPGCRSGAACESALLLLVPVASAGGRPAPGVLLATIPWLRIERQAGHQLQRALGTDTVLIGGAFIQPSGRRPTPPALLLPRSARGSFYVGDRLWTIDVRLPGLSRK